MRLSCLLVLSCLLFSGALGSSSRRSMRRHVDLARSAGQKEIREIGQSSAFSSVLPLPLKQHKKRCKARNTTGLTSVSISHSASAPVNVAPSPTSKSQNAPPPSPTTKDAPPPSPTTKKASPSPSPTTQKASPSSKPSPSPSPSPTTSHTPPAQPTSNPGSGSGGSLLQIVDNLVSGGSQGMTDLTFFAPALGACGETNSPQDLIVAIGWQLFDNYPGATANPNNNPVCNKKIKIQYQDKSLVVTVTDRCTGCQAPDLDMTPAGFSHFADQGVGRLHHATWDWCDDC